MWVLHILEISFYSKAAQASFKTTFEKKNTWNTYFHSCIKVSFKTLSWNTWNWLFTKEKKYFKFKGNAKEENIKGSLNENNPWQGADGKVPSPHPPSHLKICTCMFSTHIHWQISILLISINVLSSDTIFCMMHQKVYLSSFFVIFFFWGGGGGGASRTGVSMWNQRFNKRFTVNEKRMSKQLTFKYFLSWQPIMIIAMNEFFEKSSTQVNLRPLLSVLTMDALAIPNKKWKFKKKKLRTS